MAMEKKRYGYDSNYNRYEIDDTTTDKKPFNLKVSKPADGPGNFGLLQG